MLTPPPLRLCIGLPQIASLALLFIFALQSLYFMARVPVSESEGSYVEEGLVRLDGLTSVPSPDRTPLVPLIAAVPARVFGLEKHFAHIGDYRVLLRLPFLFAGLMLGASLWYVARRLYGNLGGYVALALYAFSPSLIIRSGQIDADIVGAWGAFGLIFTAIAVAHTLYAPREVVLWNWRRILLLGLSIAICVGAQFSLVVVLILALAFMLWVGHVRPLAALVIFAAACVFGLVLLFAVYGFYPPDFVHAFRGANWMEFSSKDLGSRLPYELIGAFLLRNGLGLIVLLAVSVVVFFVWKRSRYFGTAAPLITGTLLLVCTLVMQHYTGQTFLLVALPFLILFTAGVSTDMLESKRAVLANALVVGVVIANAMLSVYGLSELSRAR